MSSRLHLNNTKIYEALTQNVQLGSSVESVDDNQIALFFSILFLAPLAGWKIIGIVKKFQKCQVEVVNETFKNFFPFIPAISIFFLGW